MSDQSMMKNNVSSNSPANSGSEGCTRPDCCSPTSQTSERNTTDLRPNRNAGGPAGASRIQHGAGGSSEASDTRDMTSKATVVTYRPPMDLFEFSDRYEVHLDMPGASPESMEITINEGVLSIDARVARRYPENITPLLGEYGVGDYHRQIRVGEDIDRDHLSANYTNGVLVLTLAKRAERQPRRIQVNAG